MNMMNDSRLATTPQPPYYAVVFTSRRRTGGPGADDAYGAMADRMASLASQQQGFLGMESVRDEAGVGITVSYWREEDDILAWKSNAEHLVAQQLGRREWYSAFRLRVARVERAYGMAADGQLGKERQV